MGEYDDCYFVCQILSTWLSTAGLVAETRYADMVRATLGRQDV